MHRSRGFTLLEVLVALSLGAAVVLLAHRVFVGVVDGTAHVEESQTRLDRDGNARRRLSVLIGSVDVGLTEADEFQGEPHSVSFTAWDRDSHGWVVQRRITLTRSEDELLAYGLDARPLCLADSVRDFSIDYLSEVGAAGRWVQRWSSAATAPLALRLRVSRSFAIDTLLFVIGARG